MAGASEWAEKCQKQQQDNESLKAKGEKLARAAHSLRLSVTAHPDYTGEENEEWTDLVEGIDEALAEWAEEKPFAESEAITAIKIIQQIKAFTDPKGFIKQLCDQVLGQAGEKEVKG